MGGRKFVLTPTSVVAVFRRPVSANPKRGQYIAEPSQLGSGATMSMFQSVSCVVTIPVFSLVLWLIWWWQTSYAHLGADTMQLTSPYRTCSKESERCTCQGLVRFGAKDVHSTRDFGTKDHRLWHKWTDPIQVNGIIQCHESSFGKDPIFGVVKTCECSENGLLATQRTAQVQCALTGWCSLICFALLRVYLLSV